LFFIWHIASPPNALSEGVEDTVLAEFIGCLSSDEAFSKSESFPEQRAHACRILRPCIPRQSLSEILPHYSASIRAQFVNIGKISKPKKCSPGAGTHTTWCVIGTSWVPGVSGGDSDEAKEEEKDANIGEYFGRVVDMLFPVE
jgi:hypothetical protein